MKIEIDTGAASPMRFGAFAVYDDRPAPAGTGGLLALFPGDSHAGFTRATAWARTWAGVNGCSQPPVVPFDVCAWRSDV